MLCLMAETMTFRATPDLLEAVEKAAAELDTSASDVVRRAVVEYLDDLGAGRIAAYPARRARAGTQ
jgi:predicted transcriptional regulator